MGMALMLWANAFKPAYKRFVTGIGADVKDVAKGRDLRSIGGGAVHYPVFFVKAF